jgi:hypothetical protein
VKTSNLKFSFLLYIRKVQENELGMKLSGTHQLLAYADYVNPLRDNIDTIRKNTVTLTGANKEVCQKVNAKKTNYMQGKIGTKGKCNRKSAGILQMTGRDQISNSDKPIGNLLFTVPLDGAVYEGATTKLSQHNLCESCSRLVIAEKTLRNQTSNLLYTVLKPQ